MELYHLAEAADTIGPFIKKYNVANTESVVAPTLSPNAPNFSAWWEKHKSKWQPPTESGHEPADD